MLAPAIVDFFKFDHRDAVAVSLLAGWWLYAIAALITNPVDMKMVRDFALMAVVFACAIGRLGRYCTHHHAPITLWARIWSGRWVIPRHDIVYAAPLLALVVPFGLVILLRQSPMMEPLAEPIAVTLAILIATCAPPSYATWALTGDHHTRMVVKDKTRLIEI